MSTGLSSLDPRTYVPHHLHSASRTWTETNCYIDAWIELLHSLGLAPEAAGACALSSDFDGDAWRLLKYPLEDLRALYGIEVVELNMWRPLAWHLEHELGRGRVCTVEVDAYYLPDTAATTYRREHDKTTIIPVRIDLDRRELDYFHNASYFALSDEDFDGVLRRSHPEASLPPYTELIFLDELRVDEDELAEVALGLLAVHLDRRPETNPVERLSERVLGDVAALHDDLDGFHLYAFNTLRQCGATAQVAGAFLYWLADRADGRLKSAASHFDRVAEVAKTAEFVLARAARGRATDLRGPLDSMATGWAEAMHELDDRDGC